MIGAKEIDESSLTVKVDGKSENEVIKMNELHKILNL